MNAPKGSVARRIIAIMGIVLVSGILVSFALLPTPDVHSRDVVAAYSKYANAPTEETRQAYESTASRTYRPFHILQFISGSCGVALPLVLVLRRWKQRGGVSASMKRPAGAQR